MTECSLPTAARRGAQHGPMTRQARQVGILFADISGSMLLYEKLGNRGALAAIEMVLGLVSNVISQNHGFVVKTIGDEIMACLPTASDTWSAARQVQRKVEALPPIPTEQGPIKMCLRVGFAFGHAIENHGDFFGGTVNIAARMVQLAKRGQILTTKEGEEFLPKGHHYVTRSLDWLPIKGVPDGAHVAELLWKESSGERFTVIGALSAPPRQEGANELRIRLGFQEWLLDASCSRISIGREEGNDIVVPGVSASRNHATIERRRGRWVLIDHSSNGTFVTSPAHGGNIHLKHEELILGQEGTIGLGQPVSSHSDCLAFAVLRPSQPVLPGDT